jgi:hypothetical protein
MLFILLDEYAKLKDERGWDLLGIGEQQWYVYKRKKSLPLKHCRTICLTFQIQLTDDQRDLSNIVYEKYWDLV